VGARFTTISGRPIDELYTPDSMASVDYARDLADPGAFPYTRGIHRHGYRGRLWTMRQFAGYGTP
jgi:methylmalonyl-CoA mutase N-terminal domain/subunit